MNTEALKKDNVNTFSVKCNFENATSPKVGHGLTLSNNRSRQHNNSREGVLFKKRPSIQKDINAILPSNKGLLYFGFSPILSETLLKEDIPSKIFCTFIVLVQDESLYTL